VCCLYKSVDKQLIAPIRINNEFVERVTSFKLLGVIISGHLSWQEHVEYIITKASKDFMYYLNWNDQEYVAMTLLMFIVP